MYKLGAYGILQRHVLDHERPIILLEAHEGFVGGHYTRNTTTQNILHVGIWWVALHNDAKELCQICDVCQRVGKPSRRDEMHLVSQVTLQEFDKWAIDFIGPINPLEKKSRQRYIITTIDYLT